jgi:gamma-butyrobetaine dioxygenase
MTTASDPLAGIPPVWLRANCPCRACRDPVSGQRLADITELPPAVWITAASTDGDTVRVVFGPDGHRAEFNRAWLRQQRCQPPDDRGERAKRLWRAADVGAALAGTPWPRYLASEGVRERCLASLLREGFFLLRDVPREPGSVLAAAASFGHVRETNYGRLFDVRVVATPANLAYTGLPIAPHTDNPYRDPVPTVQLLHCLTAAAAGGDSGLTDGFTVAATLRDTAPSAFDVLAGTAVTFRYADADTELQATRPVIGTGQGGEIREIRFNTRSMQPLPIGPGGSAAQAVAFYAACRAFAGLAASPELTVSFRLGPGDCMVFDNTRILHSRTSFARAGQRHLQGCYADLDGAASTLAVLRRRPAGSLCRPRDRRHILAGQLDGRGGDVGLGVFG